MQLIIILVECDLEHPEWLDTLESLENEPFESLAMLKEELNNQGIPPDVREFYTLSSFMAEFNDRETFSENIGYVWLEKNDLV